MIPDSFAAFYSFLALVAPGLVFQISRERRRPALEESSFREVGRIAITSLVFTSISVVVVAAISEALPQHALIKPADWLDLDRIDSGPEFWRVVRTVSAEVVLACALAAAASIFLGPPMSGSGGTGGGAAALSRLRRRAVPPSIDKSSIWHQVFSTRVPRDEAPWVQVVLSDGTTIWGYVYLYTVGQKLGDREILLQGPGLTCESPDGEKREEGYWRYVTVKAADIVMIKVTHVPRSATTEVAPSTPAPRETTPVTDAAAPPVPGGPGPGSPVPGSPVPGSPVPESPVAPTPMSTAETR